MDVLTHGQVERLIRQSGRYCVSVYMPTPRTGAEALEGPVHLANLLRDAEERLAALGMTPPLVRELLEPARAIVADRPFWRHLGDGLAVFLSPDGLAAFRVPRRFEPMVVVGRRFLIAPLLPIDAACDRFFILALGAAAARLFEASHFDVRTLEITPAPEGGDTKDLESFYRNVDAGLVTRLRDERAPLVLAGVDALLRLYRRVNSHPHLVDAAIAGHADRLSAEELRRLAWPLVCPYFVAAREAAASRCREMLARGDGRAAGTVETIVPAADSGRVATLFVADDVHLWGTYDPKTQATQVHIDEQPGDDELIDLAAARTLLHRGTVYTVRRGEVPGGRPAAAVLRY